MSYAFLLGNHPELSLAELGAFFGDKVSLNPINKIAFTDSELPSQFLQPSQFLEVLGGTIVILKIIHDRVTKSEVVRVVSEHIKEQVDREGHKGKFPFGIDVFPESASDSPLIKQMTIGVKKYLAKAEIKSEFWNNNFRNVNRVYALKNRLLEKGVGIALLKRGGDDFMICQVVALQDIDSYSNRDYGKAARDSRAGMLPPKLAQIMINLAIFNRPYSVTFDESRRARVTIVDPFCGSGTVLMEGLLRGFSVIGSDISEKAVGQAKENVDWLRETRKISPAASAQVSLKSATELSKKDIQLSCPDITSIAVVAEPLLGPPMREEPPDHALEKIVNELAGLYLGFFTNMSKWLPSQTPIVCVFPCWRRQGGGVIKLSDRIVEKITALGYSRPAYTPLNTTSLLYSRPYSIVAREILRFVKA